MRTLLIVEDEKMIRQGIAVMARRCSVEIGEILECRNGVEALEILKNHPVDVMFTDIRMPKMDGIELVKQAGELKQKPLIVVVSGYDDFNYAVEMMKNGVKDYILKPIKREKVEEILGKLDEEILKAQKHGEKELQGFQTQLRYLFANQQVQDLEWEFLERQFQEILSLDNGVSYRLVAGGHLSSLPLSDGSWIAVEGVEQQTIFIVKEENWNQETESQSLSGSLGISDTHRELRELMNAYGEAVEARKEAFLRCVPCVVYTGRGEVEREWVPGGFAEQFVQQFSTEKMEDALRKLKNLFFAARYQPGEYQALPDVAAAIQRMLEESYARLLTEKDSEALACNSPFYYTDAKVYTEHLEKWLGWLKCCLSEQFDNDQNQNKIKEAARYIQENYQKDLNMAMVSNHVSMNYSLFSIAFKEYTGVNFVNYLKNIRISEAKRLLETTDEKILDISRRVGYENEKHFMKTFKNICGVSPSEYRKNMELLSRTKEG